MGQIYKNAVRKREPLSPRILLEQAIVDGEIDVLDEKPSKDASADDMSAKLVDIVIKARKGAR